MFHLVGGPHGCIHFCPGASLQNVYSIALLQDESPYAKLHVANLLHMPQIVGLHRNHIHAGPPLMKKNGCGCRSFIEGAHREGKLPGSRIRLLKDIHGS